MLNNLDPDNIHTCLARHIELLSHAAFGIAESVTLIVVNTSPTAQLQQWRQVITISLSAMLLLWSKDRPGTMCPLLRKKSLLPTMTFAFVRTRCHSHWLWQGQMSQPYFMILRRRSQGARFGQYSLLIVVVRAPRLKGILHQKIFYRLNLIFWIVMGCGTARFGRRSLVIRWAPPTKTSYTTPQYYPKYEI